MIIWVTGVLRRVKKMASAQVVETSVGNGPSHGSSQPDDHFQSWYVIPEFNPFS